LRLTRGCPNLCGAISHFGRKAPDPRAVGSGLGVFYWVAGTLPGVGKKARGGTGIGAYGRLRTNPTLYDET